MWLLSSGLVGLPLSMRFYVDKGDIRSWNVCIWVCVCVWGVWVHLPVLSLSLGVCISCRKILQGGNHHGPRRNVLASLGFSRTALSLLVLEPTPTGGGG